MRAPQQDQPVIIVTGADNRFAMPLAVMLYSAISNLTRHKLVELYIIEDKISEHNKRKIREVLTIKDVAVDLKWLDPDLSVLGDLPTTTWHSRAAYLR